MLNNQTSLGLISNAFQRVLIVCVVFILSGTVDLLVFLLKNYAIPFPSYLAFYFFYLPGFLLVINASVRKNLILRNMLYFIIFVVTHYSMERFLFASSYEPSEGIDLLGRIVTMFIGYIFLINTSRENFTFVSKIFIYSILLNYLIIYLDLFNVINIPELNLEYGYGGLANRVTGNYSVNTIAEQGAAALIFYGVLKAKGQRMILNSSMEFFIIVLIFSSLVFVQSTRGGLILLLLSFSIAMLSNDKSVKSFRSLKFVFVFAGVWLIISLLYYKIGLSIPVFERLVTVTTSGDSRESQITASFLNFISSPLIGVGYNNAAKIFFLEGITRSNFQYTQILASGGLLLFIVYFTFIYKMFLPSIKLLKYDIISLGVVLFILLNFVSSRPEPYLGILAYVAFRRNDFYSSETAPHQKTA